MERDGFLREMGVHFVFHRELGRRQLLLLDRDGFQRARGLHFTLSLKVRATLMGVRMVHGEGLGPGWGGGCCIANFLNVVGEGLWAQLPLPWRLGAWQMKGESEVA